jgi:uncharacterized protein YdaL
MLYFKHIENKNKQIPKEAEIIKIRAEINEIQTNKQNTIQRINETKSWFFEKLNKIDTPLSNLTKMRIEKTQISKRGDNNKHHGNP